MLVRKEALGSFLTFDFGERVERVKGHRTFVSGASAAPITC
jgi:hypothetical protein